MSYVSIKKVELILNNVLRVFLFTLVLLLLLISYRQTIAIENFKKDFYELKNTLEKSEQTFLTQETIKDSQRTTYKIISQNKNGLSSFGTAFALEYKEKKFLITNEHIVINPNDVVFTNDNYTFKNFSWFKRIEELDLIIYPLEEEVPTLKINNKDLKVAQNVFTVGYPFDLDKTYSFGYITSLNNTLENEKINKQVIQTSVPTNKGNSGGPLLSKNGELIGIVFSKAENSEGITFAIPVEELLPHINTSKTK